MGAIQPVEQQLGEIQQASELPPPPRIIRRRTAVSEENAFVFKTTPTGTNDAEVSYDTPLTPPPTPLSPTPPVSVKTPGQKKQLAEFSTIQGKPMAFLKATFKKNKQKLKSKGRRGSRDSLPLLPRPKIIIKPIRIPIGESNKDPQQSTEVIQDIVHTSSMVEVTDNILVLPVVDEPNSLNETIKVNETHTETDTVDLYVGDNAMRSVDPAESTNGGHAIIPEPNESNIVEIVAIVNADIVTKDKATSQGVIIDASKKIMVHNSSLTERTSTADASTQTEDQVGDRMPYQPKGLAGTLVAQHIGFYLFYDAIEIVGGMLSDRLDGYHQPVLGRSQVC